MELPTAVIHFTQIDLSCYAGHGERGRSLFHYTLTIVIPEKPIKIHRYTPYFDANIGLKKCNLPYMLLCNKPTLNFSL